MTGPPSLSEATAALEAMAYDGVHIDGDRLERYVRAVITEYDRRGAIVRAAEAYVNPPANDPVWKSDRYAELEALVRPTS